MRRRCQRAMTLAEILISCTLLLVMIGMTSFACVSYLRAYRQYTDKGLRVRLAAKSLEALTFQLRSARVVYQPDRATLEQGSSGLSYADDQGQLWQLQFRNHEIWLEHGQERRVVFSSVESLRLREEQAEHGRLLRVEVRVQDINAPFTTALSWREALHR